MRRLEAGEEEEAAAAVAPAGSLLRLWAQLTVMFEASAKVAANLRMAARTPTAAASKTVAPCRLANSMA